MPSLAFAAPSPPSGLSVTAGTSSPVVASVSWTPSSDTSVTEYHIYAAVATSGQYMLVGVTADTSFSFVGGIPGMAYYIRVAAANQAGDESTKISAGPVASTWTESPHATHSASANQCSLCHGPHAASDTSGLMFRWEISSAGPGSMCLACHSGEVSNAANVASGTADSFGLKSGHTLDASSTGSAALTGCASCHQAHGAADEGRMIVNRRVNETTVTAAGRSLCETCHDANNSFFGTGYPSVSSPTYDATGYPVLGTWPGPSAYDSASNAHARIPATTQTVGPGTPVRYQAGDCLYCHAAHKGPNAYDGLVATFTVPSMSTLAADQSQGAYATLCLGCHKSSAASGFTTAPVDIKSFVTTSSDSAGHRVITPGGLLPVGAPLPCFECHGPHGSTRNNASGLSDALGRNLETSTTAGVRAFCFTCHTTADSAKGWNSETATFTSVASTVTIVGLRRDGDVSGTRNNLRLPAGPLGHAQGDSAMNCYACHGNSYASPSDHNVHDPSMGSYDGPTHTGAPLAQLMTIGGVTYPGLTCDECHSLELGVEHAKATSSSAALGCTACHPSPRNTLVPEWDKTTCVEGGCHVPATSAAMHSNIETDHVLPVGPCTAAGCHDTNLADIHSTATTTVAGSLGAPARSLASGRAPASGVTLTSCQVCHARGVPTTNDCTSSGCHSGMSTDHYDAAQHTATLTSATVTILGADFGTHACNECHLPELKSEHAKSTSSSAALACKACHKNPAASTKPWNKSCVTAGCHAAGGSAPQHRDIDLNHIGGAGQTCFASGCHTGSGNIAAIHSKEGCAPCHGAGKTPSAVCSDCHDTDNPHPHPIDPGQGDITVLSGSTSHGSNENSGQDANVYVDCKICHAPDLRTIHGDNCALCHQSGDQRVINTIANGFTTCWTCHDSAHANADTNHDAAYANGGGSCACHDSSWDVGEGDCAGCHTLVDSQPPVTSSDGLASYVGPATVHLSADDPFPSHGIAHTYYRLDGGSRTEGMSIDIAAPASGSSSHTLEYWSVDVEGHEETHRIQTIATSADTTAPQTTSNAKSSYVGLAKIQFTATDDGTQDGVRATYYILDGGAQTAGTVLTVANPSVPTSHTLEFWSVDRSGNPEAHHSIAFSSTKDTFAPVTTETGANQWVRFYRLWISLDAVDVGDSGVAASYAIIDGTQFFSSASTGHYSIDPGSTYVTEGMHTLKYWSTDAVGNIESQNTTSFGCDMTGPTLSSNAAPSYTGTATITLSATDTFSGIAADSFAWQLDGGTVTSGTVVTVAPPATGSLYHHLTWTVKDVAGNAGYGSSYFYSNEAVDSTPPTGTMSVNNNAAYANSTAVTVNSAVTDAGSGMSQMRIDPGTGIYGSWIAYAASSAITLPSGDGTKTVNVQYRDVIGNVLSLGDTIRLDATAPTGSMSVNNNAAYAVTTTVSVNSTVTDTYSGMSQMRIDPGSGGYGSWISYAATSSITLPSGDGAKTVRVQYRDNAGVVLLLSDTIILDTAGPTGIMSVNNNSTYATTTAVSVNSTVTDAGSGLAQMAVDPGTGTYGSWVAYSASYAITLPAGDGTKTVNVRYKDNVGTITTISDTIVLDSVGPTGVMAVNNGAIYTTATPVSVNSTVTDTYSGLAQMRIDPGSGIYGSWISYTASSPIVLPSGDGTKTVNVQYSDNAGNVVTLSDTIRLDTMPPSGAMSINNGAATVATTSASVNSTVTDTYSGISQMRIDPGSGTYGAWISYAALWPITLPSGAGTKTVNVQYRDVAGNVASLIDTISLTPTGTDITPPMTTSNAVASYIGTATISLTATDNVGGSGVKATYYALDAGAMTTGTVVVVAPPASGSVAHTLKFWSVDNATNIETVNSVGFMVAAPDITAPTTASNVQSSYDGTATITLAPSDTGGSGLKATYFRLDGGGTTTGTVITVNPPISGAATHTVSFWSVDNSNNVEASNNATFSVRAVTSRSFSFTGANQTFVVPSGVTSITVRLDGGAGGKAYGGYGGYGGSLQAVVPVAPGGTITVRVGGRGSVDVYDNGTGHGGWPNGGDGDLGSDWAAGGGGSTSIWLGSQILAEAGGGGGGSDMASGTDGGDQGSGVQDATHGFQTGGDPWGVDGGGGGGGWNAGIGSGGYTDYSSATGGTSFIALGLGTLTPGANAGEGSAKITW